MEMSVYRRLFTYPTTVKIKPTDLTTLITEQKIKFTICIKYAIINTEKYFRMKGVIILSDKTDLIQSISGGQELSRRQQLWLVARLSVPAILAQLSSIIMQYIDAAMVGSLGADASAAIGLVTSSSWLLGGLCTSAAAGFSVQAAQFVGAKRNDKARDVFRQSLITAAVFGLLLCAAGVSVSPFLPVWLGGRAEITAAASSYFFIFSCALPAAQFRQLAGSMLQCSGDMKTPSALNIVMCILDVAFNFLLIFPERDVLLFGGRLRIFGAGLGVTGAALGTALSEAVVALLMMYAACKKSSVLKLKRETAWKPNPSYYKTAAYISLPLAFEHIVLCGAQVALTHITAPLGTAAIAANSLAVTAESLCYMPGYGIGSAATTLVGQSIGAGRRELAKRYAGLSVILGIVLMTLTGVLMFIFSPYVFAMLTPDEEVRMLGTQVLRIEAFAEPLYAASIVTAGALRGAGDTRIPSILNLVSMWGVRLTAAWLMAPRFGLHGVWLAMCGELCVRGILFLVRLIRGKWLQSQ